ncbi:T complex protein 1 theta subunit [Encephalitozoon intestinalis ATCC 50506]|uniref:T complex protein 1 theta subunit n=1 Tax=Encephalitozoon intestinalis (strain ATCC 50506) TaxID=876142 RepID=E0S6Q4_ENCIT|nr:T complex protein 1 theta subunit [Encephalitozoon intestinalis ATCC 50506]ADM11389.1 T complex protein 1 theta subunit [Encephalitozoon intestinalis ATCC 50506]UTX45080.1 T complex protein 1 theta subunit [Encephalitozoon intestinalis]
MDIGQTHLGGLISNSQQDEKVRYHVVGSRVKMACNVIRSLYGGSHRTKLIVNGYGQVILSSQPGVIYDNIKINHPLVKLLQDYVKKMDVVGDGATFFVTLVSELIQEAMDVVGKGMKGAYLGYMLREVHKEIEELASELRIKHEVDFEDRESISKVLKGVLKDSVLEKIVVEGISLCRSFSTENIRVCKVVCGSTEDSYVVQGMVFNRSPEGEVKHVTKGKTSIYNCPLDISRTELKGTVLMRTASELLSFSKEENKRIKETVESMNGDVVICSGKVDKIYLDFLNKKKKLVFRITSKYDLRRIRELVGGHILAALDPQTEDSMGFVEEVETFKEGNSEYTKFISGSKKVYTLVLKNSVQAVLDEQERMVQKALNVLSKNSKEGKIDLVDGAGRFEKKLSKIFLERSMGCKEGKNLVYKCIGKALGTFKTSDAEVYDAYNAKVKALKYSIEFISTLFETGDYLIGKPEAINIAPKSNQHWDEDH